MTTASADQTRVTFENFNQLFGGALNGDFVFDVNGRIELAPLDIGILRLHGEAGPDAGIEVGLRPYGIGLPTGVEIRLRGLSATEIRLRDCVVDGFGHFSVTSTRRTLASTCC